MTGLDSSVIIDILDGFDTVCTYIDAETRAPYFTSAICVYEVLMGPVKSPNSVRLHDERQEFAWVRSLALDETIAIEATRIQDALTDQGFQMPARDVLIAATARSTGEKSSRTGTSLSIAFGRFSTSSNSPSESPGTISGRAGVIEFGLPCPDDVSMRYPLGRSAPRCFSAVREKLTARVHEPVTHADRTGMGQLRRNLRPFRVERRSRVRGVGCRCSEPSQHRRRRSCIDGTPPRTANWSLRRSS